MIAARRGASPRNASKPARRSAISRPNATATEGCAQPRRALADRPFMPEKTLAEPVASRAPQHAPSQAPVTPDHHPPSPSQVDRLAASSSDDRELDDAKLLVMNSFMWMNDAAQQKIDA